MDKLWILFFAIVCIAMASCEKDPAEKRITFLKTILGGCNINDANIQKSTEIEESDTVIISRINEDTLNVHVGKNFSCCAPFISQAKVQNDSLIMEISDTCSVIENCYCKCQCYYTWDFQYVDFEKKKYNLKVKLTSPLLETPIILAQGEIDLSN